MKSRINLSSLALILAIGAKCSLQTAYAAIPSLTWEDAHDIAAATDVRTTGKKAAAYAGFYGPAHSVNWKNEYTFQGNQILNGVAFQNGYTSNGFQSYISVNSATRDASESRVASATVTALGQYAKMLRGGVISTANSGVLRMTPKNVQANKKYLVQFWLQDASVAGADATLYIGTQEGLTADSADKIATCNKDDSGLGQYLVAVFQTDETGDAPNIYIVPATAGVKAIVNMYQLREITEDMVWSPENDSTAWNTTGANWEGQSAEATLWDAAAGYAYNAVIGSGASVVVDGDVAAQSVALTDASLTVPDSSSLTLNGALSVSASSEASVIGAVSAKSLDAVVTGGTLTLDAEIPASSSLSLAMTPKTITEADVNADPWTSVRADVARSMNFTTLSGGGKIDSDVPQVVTIADGTSKFYGSLAGEMSLTKEGNGVLVLQGPNTFTGTLTVNAGTLSIGSRLADMSGVRYHLDATETNRCSFVDDTLEISAFSSGALTYREGSVQTSNSATWTPTGHATYLENGNFFGGKPVFYFNDSVYTLANNTYDQATIIVYQGEEQSSARIARDYYSNDDVEYYNGMWHIENGSPTWAIYVNGKHYSSVAITDKAVLSLATRFSRSSRADMLGGNFKGAIAEAVGFANSISVEDRAAIESYLMSKWGCDAAADHQILPKTASVSVKTGAVLDLGGLTQKVASLSLGGTITNGTLAVTGAATFTAGAKVYVTVTDEELPIRMDVLTCASADGLENLTVVVLDGDGNVRETKKYSPIFRNGKVLFALANGFVIRLH